MYTIDLKVFNLLFKTQKSVLPSIVPGRSYLIYNSKYSNCQCLIMILLVNVIIAS